MGAGVFLDAVGLFQVPGLFIELIDSFDILLFVLAFVGVNVFDDFCFLYIFNVAFHSFFNGLVQACLSVAFCSLYSLV